MFLIPQNTTFLRGFNDFTFKGANINAAQFTRVTTYQQESRDITILTAEGDKITISADSQVSAGYAGYSGIVKNNRALCNFKAQNMVIDSGRDLYISVEGDLSSRELEDIKKAIKAVDKIMGQILSGDMEKALAMTSKLASLDSISGLEASLELEKTVTTEQTCFTAANKETVETINDRPSEDSQVIQAPFKSATDRIMDALLNSGVRPAKIFRPFDQYSSKLLKSLSGKDDVNQKAIETTKLIRADVLERIKGLLQEEEAPEEAAITQQVPETDTDAVLSPEMETETDIPMPETVLNSISLEI